MTSTGRAGFIAATMKAGEMNIFDSLATQPHDFAIPIVDAHHHLWDLNAGRYPTKQDQ